MKEFETIDINGNKCRFRYSKGEIDMDDKITIRVFGFNNNDTDKWFSYRLKIIDDTLAKSEMLNQNLHLEFKKKGIPEAIIPIASQELNRDIISSPITYQIESDSFLTDASRKAWERLVENDNNAYKDERIGRFFYSNNNINQ